MGIKLKKKGIVQFQAIQIYDCGSKQLKLFSEKHIDNEANIRTDKWKGYIALKKEYKYLNQVESNPKKNFRFFHRQMMILKAWLRRIQNSVKNLQLCF
jgi:hypothetical protein